MKATPPQLANPRHPLPAALAYARLPMAGEITMQPNWQNRTMWTGDNLEIMRGMNSASVDLIYLDPPFNSNRTYSAPISSEGEIDVFGC